MNNLKNILQFLTVTFLVSLILFQTSKDALVLSWFNLNQDSIISEHCININYPETMCNAKCYLDKILSSDNQNHDVPQFVSSQTLDITFFIKNDVVWKEIESNTDRDKTLNPYIERLLNRRIYSNIDHPPEV